MVPSKQQTIDAIVVLACAAGWTVVHQSDVHTKKRWPAEPGLIVVNDDRILVFYVTVKGRLTENELRGFQGFGDVAVALDWSDISKVPQMLE